MKATKKTAKKAAAKPKAMTTDEAIAAMKAWRALKPQQRDWCVYMDPCQSKKIHCRVRHEEDRNAWNPASYYGSDKSLSVAITKALAAAKKAGHG